jgi:hypothetical protein
MQSAVSLMVSTREYVAEKRVKITADLIRMDSRFKLNKDNDKPFNDNIAMR